MPESSNFGWIMPTVGGSSGSWGTLLNNFVLDGTTGLDKVLGDIKKTADDALSRVNGGVMEGEIDTLTQVFTEVVISSGPSPEIDLAAGDFFRFTVTETASFSFAAASLPAAGNVAFIVIELTDPGAFGLTWPTSVKWPGGTQPTDWTDPGVDVVSMYTRDGGTTWRAARVQKDSS